MRALIVSYAMVVIGAALWLTGSILVAFPAHFTALDFDAIFDEFLTKSQHPLTVLILLSIDIGIAIFMLKDFRMRDGLAAGGRLGIIFLCVLIFIITALYLPQFNAQVVRNHTLFFAFLSLGPMLVIRAMSYAPPQRARRFRRPGSGEGNEQ